MTAPALDVLRAFLDNCVPGMTDPDVPDCDAALADLDALVQALDGTENCPVCGNSMIWGHAKGCALARVTGEAR